MNMSNNLNPPDTSQIHIPYKILIQQSELFINNRLTPSKKYMKG